MRDYLDIIVFAVIAVGLLWRLRSVLGDRHDGDVQKPLALRGQLPGDGAALRRAGALPLVGGDTPGQERWAQNGPDFTIVDSATVHGQLAQFLVADPSFRPADFIDKAKKAFNLILTAFSGGNRVTLGYLLAPVVLVDFNRLLDAREVARETYITQVQNISKAIITEAELAGTDARITVEFTAEQGVTHKDGEGRIIAQNDGHRRVTRDRWVFARDLKDPAPTWLLTQILAHEDQ